MEMKLNLNKDDRGFDLLFSTADYLASTDIGIYRFRNNSHLESVTVRFSHPLNYADSP